MPSRARMIISLEMEKRSGGNKHPCLTSLFMSWEALKSFPIIIAAVCSQYVTQQHQMGNKSGIVDVFFFGIFGKNKVLALHW